PGSNPPRYWNNDSVWLDLGFPVMKTPDGRKFKPLFAPLIVDLDNRINLNVHGNVRGAGPAHVSNQGWGPWEVNVGRVLRRGNEWANLFTGSAQPAQSGRYGGRDRPGGGAVAPQMPAPPFYAQVDFDGHDERTGGPSGGALLPGSGGTPALSCFPHFNR